MAFPSNPTLNQQVLESGRAYQWNGTVWNLVSVVAGHAATHGASGADPVSLSVSQIANAQKAITSGTAAPSGGSDGDIYLRYT